MLRLSMLTTAWHISSRSVLLPFWCELWLSCGVHVWGMGQLQRQRTILLSHFATPPTPSRLDPDKDLKEQVSFQRNVSARHSPCLAGATRSFSTSILGCALWTRVTHSSVDAQIPLLEFLLPFLRNEVWHKHSQDKHKKKEVQNQTPAQRAREAKHDVQVRVEVPSHTSNSLLSTRHRIAVKKTGRRMSLHAVEGSSDGRSRPLGQDCSTAPDLSRLTFHRSTSLTRSLPLKKT